MTRPTWVSLVAALWVRTLHTLAHTWHFHAEKPQHVVQSLARTILTATRRTLVFGFEVGGALGSSCLRLRE